MTDQVDLARQAAGSLRLHDLVLHTSKFERPSDQPVETAVDALQQFKRQVDYALADKVEGDATTRVLIVFVRLGLRVVNQDELEGQIVYYVIEADYRVEFAVTADAANEALAAFAQVNAVHNVWPFWRHHVFDIVQRGKLPQLEVPLYSVKM